MYHGSSRMTERTKRRERRSSAPVAVGLFVGGASRRMGHPKGWLHSPQGVPLIERWLDLCDRHSLPVVLVGRRPEYAAVMRPQLPDDPPAVGPIGGLRALLRWAGRRSVRRVVAAACDMPFVRPEDLARLVAAPGGPAAWAARRGSRWEPFLSRYDVFRSRGVVEDALAAGRHSLQRLLDALSAATFSLEAERLSDWDTPEDVRRAW